MSLLAQQYILIREEQTNGTAGGTFTSGAYRTRVLNTTVQDTGGHVVSLSSNQITLAAGTYRIEVKAPARYVDNNKLRLQNVTDSATLLLGQNALALSGTAALSGATAHLSGRFTIAASKAIEVQHQCQTTRATDGFGNACSFGDTEVYTVVELWKE